MKNLLLNVSPDPGQESRLAIAVFLAKSLGGHITCLQCIAPPISVGDPPAVPPDVVELLEKGAAELQADVEARLAEAEVEWTWIREFGADSAIVGQSVACVTSTAMATSTDS